MGLNNLSPRDTVLVIVIINLVCYFIGFQAIVSPLINLYKTTDAQRISAAEERNDLQREADSEKKYDDTIYKLKNERRDEINSKFYQTVTAEKFHRWFSNLKKSSAVNLTNFEIKRVVTMTQDGSGKKVEADFVDNQISLTFTSTYAQLVDLMQEIEGDGKASALTALNVTPDSSGGTVSTKLTYSFYSITKAEGEDSSFTSGALELGSPASNPEQRIGNVAIGRQP